MANSLANTTHARQERWLTHYCFDCRKLSNFVISIMSMDPGAVQFTETPQDLILDHDGPVEERPWLTAGDHVVPEVESVVVLVFTLA